MDRAEKAVEYKHNKNNCCQAVLKAFADKLPFDEKTLGALGSGFGNGMGCTEATCGALCGAVIAAGILNDSGKPTTAQSKTMLRNFKEASGAVSCADLKGIKTGIVLCSCDDCVRNAVYALEKALETFEETKKAKIAEPLKV